MPNGPANNAPHCPTCGIYLRVHGCTAARCANPASGPDGAVVNWADGSPEGREVTVRLVPPGYVSIASTGAEVQASRVCGCDVCEADGQHAPMCAVHWEPPRPCDCGKVSPG